METPCSRSNFRVTTVIDPPPVDGEANERLINFLARAFGVARAGVHLEQGQRGRHKRVRVQSPRRLPPGFDWP